MKGTSSLPTQDNDQSDHDQDSVIFEDDGRTAFVIRLTPDEKYTEDDVLTWLKDKFDFWVIGTETKPQLHFHIVVSTFLDDIKPLVRDFLYKYWPVRERGWGNKQFNCTFSENEDQGVSYAIKEGKYQFFGYEEDYIKERYEASFKKNSTVSFTTEFALLKKEFGDTDMDTRTFMTKFCLLKAKYNQMVNISHAYQYSLSVLFNRDPSQAESFVENYLYKQ